MLPAQQLREAIADGWIRSDDYRIPPEAIQPASLDLRLGEFAWALRCSFLPDRESKVEEKIAGIAFQTDRPARRRRRSSATAPTSCR